MRARGKPKVVWKDGPQSHIKKLLPHPYVEEVKLPTDLVETYMVSLVPGGLFRLRYDMRSSDDMYPPGVYERHEYPYITSSPRYTHAVGPGAATHRAGSVALYAGQVRVTESGSRRGEVLRLTRHSFIIDSVRYLTCNLHDFEPIL